MENKKPVLEISNLCVGFNSHGKKMKVIRNINLDVYEGETLAIVGESGSGKSVFTKTFTGMLESNGFINEGSIMFHGQDLTKLKLTLKTPTYSKEKIFSINLYFIVGEQKLS